MMSDYEMKYNPKTNCVDVRKRELFEVWKDPFGYGSKKWKVKLPHGIESFMTKKHAVEFGEEWKKYCDDYLPEEK